MSNKLSALVAACVLVLSGAASAGVANTTFKVTATVIANCTVTATDMNFGNYDPVVANAASPAGDIAQTSTVTVTCTKKAPYTVAFDKGTNGASVTTRQMKDAVSGDLLNYSLFRDAARTQNWGATVGTDTVAGTGNGLAQAITVYGKLPGAQNVSVGSYLDTINVTLNY